VGQAPVIGATSGWFLQAVDAAGNSAVTTNKTFFFAPTDVGDIGEFTTAFSGAAGTAPFFRSGGQLTVGGPSAYQASIDGGAFQPVPAGGLTITGDGEHIVQVLGADGSGGTVIIRIDSTPPTIDIAVPAIGQQFGLNQSVASSFSCDDALSGIATCNGPATVATSQSGAFDFTVTATDNAGNAASSTHPYSVAAALTFLGFFSPVDNYPGPANPRTAGAKVPVKWEVRNAQGQPLTSLSLIQSLTSQQVQCNNPSVTIGGSTNEFNPSKLTTPGGQFNFNWDTKSSYAHTCRMLTLRLTDGVAHRALFSFG
jgi:hypothetical protein